MYSAIVIGCGRIGAFLDEPDAETILTHAKMFSLHPEFNLIAVLDTSLEKVENASRIFNCQGLKIADKIPEHLYADIISICVPTEYHYPYLISCLDLNPRAVIAEKPLTGEPKMSRQVVDLYEQAHIPLFVNYIRRYDGVSAQLCKRIENGDLGKIFNVVIRYTGGIMHNGSHGIDMANMLFGRFLSARTLGSITDASPTDTSVKAVLSYSLCSDVFLIPGDEKAYSMFEIDIVAEKGRVLFTDTGVICTEFTVQNDPLLEEKRKLVMTSKKNTELERSFSNLANNITGHLTRGEKIVCTGSDAVLAEEICQELLRKSRLNEKQDVT